MKIVFLLAALACFGSDKTVLPEIIGGGSVVAKVQCVSYPQIGYRWVQYNGQDASLGDYHYSIKYSSQYTTAVLPKCDKHARLYILRVTDLSNYTKQ